MFIWSSLVAWHWMPNSADPSEIFSCRSMSSLPSSVVNFWRCWKRNSPIQTNHFLMCVMRKSGWFIASRHLAVLNRSLLIWDDIHIGSQSPTTGYYPWITERSPFSGGIMLTATRWSLWRLTQKNLFVGFFCTFCPLDFAKLGITVSLHFGIKAAVWRFAENWPILLSQGLPQQQ